MMVLGLSDMPLQLFSIQEQLQEADGDLQKRITIVNETLTPLISHILELHSNSDLHKSCDDLNKIIKSKDIVARRLIFKIDAIVYNIEKIIKLSSSCLESNPPVQTSPSTQFVSLAEHSTCVVGEEDGSGSTLTAITQVSVRTPFGSFPSSLSPTQPIKLHNSSTWSVSSSSGCHPSGEGGEIVGWGVDSKTVERAVLAAVPLHIPTAIASLMAAYVPVRQEGVFDENDWNEFCGKVKPAPPLPSNIEEIWEGLCPIFPGKKVKESHVLVYLPTTVDDKPLTLRTLGEIAKKRYFPHNDSGYRYIGRDIAMGKVSQPQEAANWVLMTKTAIDGSRGEEFERQKIRVEELDKISYTAPTMLQASICSLTHYMHTSPHARLLDDKTFTLCKDDFLGFELFVGGFSSDGLSLQSFFAPDGTLDRENIGSVVLRVLRRD